jgi:hypothetical protein
MPPIEAHPGFKWERVRWDGAAEAVRNDCSYCGAAIPEEAVPLRMWDARGNACVFCDPCAERWFGLETYPDPEPDDV